MGNIQHHDAFFRDAFGRVDVARRHLELLLPADLCALLDFDSLVVHKGASFVDEALRQSHGDMLYELLTRSGKPAFIYVVHEAQSSFEWQMPLRLLRYMLRIWKQWINELGKRG